METAKPSGERSFMNGVRIYRDVANLQGIDIFLPGHKDRWTTDPLPPWKVGQG